MFDMYSIVKRIFNPIISFILNILIFAGVTLFVLILLFFAVFFIKYKFNFFKPNLERLREHHIKFLPYNLLRWFIVDLLTKKSKEFNKYGFTIFVGRQGAGKTISMVQYLRLIRHNYPKCIIVTNFSCSYSDHIMADWNDFFNIRNGTDGVVFAIDEIHSEYSAESWKDFPESLLSEISQQRKQRVKIIASSQAYRRVAKQLREQSMSVVVCKTFLNRLTCTTEYDAYEYDSHISGGFRLSKGIKSICKNYYVQSDALRGSYDTFEKIKRMEKTKFINRKER